MTEEAYSQIKEGLQDALDTIRAGHLNAKPLVEEIVDEAGRLASNPAERTRYVPAAAPHMVATAEATAQIGAVAAVIVLRRRHLLTEQALEMLKREGL